MGRVASIGTTPGDRRGMLWCIALPLVAGGAAGIVCYLIAGNSLDLFLGGLCFTSILVCPMAAIAGRLPGTLFVSLALTLGMACSWFLPVHERLIAPGQWIMCLLVLWTFLFALSSLVLVMMRLGLSAIASVTWVQALAIAWLSWPIWLSGILPGVPLRWCVAVHPLFAINATLTDLGIWTEQQVAYGLTTMGQDVPYQLPASGWVAIAFQGGVAMLMSVLSVSRISRMAPRSTNQIETEASSISNT